MPPPLSLQASEKNRRGADDSEDNDEYRDAPTVNPDHLTFRSYRYFLEHKYSLNNLA
jgi:hypothetical protein